MDKRIEARALATWLLTAATLATSSGAAAAAQMPTRALLLDDYYAIVDVSDPAISPDGERIAFVRTTIVEAENRRHREIWIAASDDTASPRRLTDPTRESAEPIWSPDGRRLAFRSQRGTDPDGDNGAWHFLDLEGGGEAFRIEGVEGRPVFSPDGIWIAYTRAIPPSGEARRRSGRSRYEVRPQEVEAIEERFAGRIIEWMQYRADGRGYVADPRDPVATPPRELFLVPARGGPARQLTDLGVDVVDVAWSPDSNRIAFAADLAQRDEHTYEKHDLWATDLNGNLQRLSAGPDVDRRPIWDSPTSLVFRRHEGLDALIARRADRGAPVRLYRMEVPDSVEEPRAEVGEVTPGWEHGVDRHVIPAAGETVYFLTDVDGEQHLFAVAARGGEVRAVTSGARWISDVSLTPDGARMAYVASTSTRPDEIYVATPGEDERRVTRFNDLLLSDVMLSSARNFRYPSADGTEIEGWMILPAGATVGTGPWPMVLAMHGGPHGAYGERFSFEFQLWATAGYAVLYTNPRGSTGYGQDFLWATWGGGWGGLDYEDVMAGVDRALATWEIDPARLGVTGYSYGGFLTNWVISQTDRFAAAVSGAGISNWISDYATADIPRTKESEFYGPPWHDDSAELLWYRSPVRHAAGVSTPTLFLHGEQDWRVPIEQAEQMYLALRKQRVPARMVRYPEASHGGWSPWDDLHSAWQTLEWWRRWLRPTS